MARQFGIGDVAFTVEYPGNRRRQLVVFFLPNGIKLVVVAARTIDREPDKRLPHRADNLLQLILTRGFFHELATTHDCVVQPGDKETDRLLPGWVARFQHISGDLHAREFIVRHVVVHRVNDPVAIRPEIVADVVPLKTVALAKPREIQPVPPPALAVVRRT